jgi:hypothetical protein
MEFTLHQIHRFEIPPGSAAGSAIGVAMPANAKCLDVTLLNNRIFVHMLFDAMGTVVTRRFLILGDNMAVGVGPDGRTIDQLPHLGSVVSDAHNLVLHVFDGGESVIGAN